MVTSESPLGMGSVRVPHVQWPHQMTNGPKAYRVPPSLDPQRLIHITTPELPTFLRNTRGISLTKGPWSP